MIIDVIVGGVDEKKSSTKYAPSGTSRLITHIAKAIAKITGN